MSRIYALPSVKFSGLKLWLFKKSDKYEVCGLELEPGPQYQNNHGEGGLVLFLGGESEGVVARLVPQGQGGIIENKNEIIKSDKIKLDKGAGRPILSSRHKTGTWH